MAVFPDLSVKVSIENFNDEASFDPTIRSKYEGGYIFTRPAFTRIIRKYNFVYDGITLSDITALKTFESEVKIGSDAWDWINPDTNQTLTVRLLKPIKYSKNKDYSYKAVLEVEEV